MTSSPASEAFRAEAAALGAVAAGLAEPDLRRPSPCPPWTIADLLCHVVIASGRVDQAVQAAAGASPAAPLATAAGYYRPDARFSAAVNADRIDVATALADRLRTPEAIHAQLIAACQHNLAILEAAPRDQRARTRHGDLMLLTDFAVTRVLELGVHGLDLAVGLDRQPWLTGEAAGVLERLLLPDGTDAAALAARLGCDRAGLIARLTGRVPLSAADQATLASAGVHPLALG
ncbi:MAG TPA: maleylpyruvate isomerase N-terminal domain-containing protein [Streptosporangiaceae bacterium]|nr:maleylpyruvate isomerase N-terminal domain-containing protein [Streptosporangiaceae bacterium]